MVSVCSTPGSKGLLTANSYSSATITASYNGLTATTTVTVTQPAVTTITLTPASPTIASGTAIQLQATATFEDGSTQNVTTLASWASVDSAVATVNNAGTKGLVTGVAAGTTTITVTYNGVTGNATIVVQ